MMNDDAVVGRMKCWWMMLLLLDGRMKKGVVVDE